MDDNERYCLGLLVEEMGEALQLIGKAMRFGLDSPGVKRLDGMIDMDFTPRSGLPIELGDLLAAIDFNTDHGTMNRDAIFSQLRKKYAKLTDPDAKDNLGRPLAPQPKARS